MLFALPAQASDLAGGALAATGQAVHLPATAAGAIEAQTASQAANAAAIVGAAEAVVESVSSAGGREPVPAPSGGEATAAAPGGGAPAPAPPAPSEPSVQPEPHEAGQPAGGSLQSQGPSGPQTSASGPDAAGTQAGSRPGSSGAIATVAAVSVRAGATRDDATTAATAPARERQAEAALRLWSWSAWREGEQLSLFVPDLRRLMAEFRSLARDITSNITGETPSKIAGAAALELALVLTAVDAPLPSGSAYGSLAPAHLQAAAVPGVASAWRLSALASATRASEAVRDTQKTSVAAPTATSPTVAAWLPSAAGAAFGSGMTGAAAPAAALLAVLAVCLLGTWLPRRLADDGLAFRSALLNFRLERPG
jgi:hypothetical protein